MRSLVINLFLVFALLHLVQTFDVNYFDDNVLYRISTNKRDVLDHRIGDESYSQRLVPIVSADDEKYICILPEIVTKKSDPIVDYTGPTPEELLSAIYKEKFCSLRIESYWRYELCHGKFVRQFHEDKESKTLTEYFLGSYPKDKNEATPEFDPSKPPMKDFDGKLLPYFPVTYVHGTHCDLTGQPRRTTVMYICAQDTGRSFLSITEVKSCVYEAVVAVKELCAHPVFKKDPPPEHEIQCFANEDVDNPVPKSMLRFQNEIKARPMLPLKSNEGPLTQRVPAQYVKNDVFDIFTKGSEAMKQMQELKHLLEAVRKPKKAPPAEDMLSAFWNGKACLYGGHGYWKYEFCFNKQVSQYHDEPNGQTTRIMLGYFDEKLHKEWVEKSGVEARQTEGNHVKKVSNMYSRGDICKESNTLRKCEVRLTCRKATEDDADPDAINMYLVEPKKCNYLLLVESSLLCDKLQTADEFGILALNEAPPAEEEEGDREEAPEADDDIDKTGIKP